MRFSKLIILSLVLFAATAFAQLTVVQTRSGAATGATVAVDTIGTGNHGYASSLTFSFNNAAGTSLWCSVNIGSSAATSITSVTYNGVPMTQAAAVGWDGVTHDASWSALYYLMSPATGAHDVVISTPSADILIGGCVSLTGVSATPIAQTPVTAREDSTDSTTATVTLNNTATGNLILAQMGTGLGYTSTTNTLNWSDVGGTNKAGGVAASTRQAGGGSVTMSNTVTASYWGIVAVEIAHE